MNQEAVIKPVGLLGDEDHAHVCQYLGRLVVESKAESAEWIARAERNLEVYQMGASPEPPASDIVSNSIQDAVNATVDFATKEPPIRKLNPVERGEPGKVFYFDVPDANAPIQGPFTEDQAAQMQQMQVLVGVDPMSGMAQTAPQFNPKNFVTINDQSTTEYFQKPLDVYWNRGRLDQGGRMVVHYGHVFGFLFPIYEWDKDWKKPRLWFDIPIRDVYVDPFRTCVEDMAYAGVDWWIDAELAKAMFPHLSDIIEERARTGTPERPDFSSSSGAEFNKSGSYRRNTIILRVFWLRNQPCPYTTEQGIADGMLERKIVPVMPDVQIVDEESQFPKGVQDDESSPNSAGSTDGVQEPAEGPTEADGAGNEGTAGPIVAGPGIPQAVAPVVQPTREALYANGVEVTPPTPNDHSTLDPNWPMYRCTRQLITVLGLVVDDRECEYFDIPMLHMIATPIPYQPFGQGLPERLESMQAARTQMLTGIADHTDLHAHPVSVVPQSAWDVLPQEYKEVGAKRAGMTLVLPDETAVQMATGKIFADPPPMSESLVKAEEIFHGELSERSGNPEVMRGETPPGVESGYAIQLLTQNASNRFGFSQQWTRDFYVRLTKFVMHDITNPMKVSARDLREIDSRYPLALIEQFQMHGARLEWNCDVDLQTGASSVRNKKQALAVEANKILDPITGFPALSTQSLSDELDIDFETEQQRNAEQQQRAMQAQMAMAAAMPQPAQKPGGEKKPSGNGQPTSNGNGRM